MTKQEILEKLRFDLELRNRSNDTVEDYQTHVRMFQDHFDKPADQMGEEEISKYLHYLLTEKGNSPATVNARNSALRFVYGVTLDVVLNLKKIPRIKTTRKIPDVPTKEELEYLFYLTKNIKHKAAFMTIYGSGLRVSEAVNLKIRDIDSKQMRILIRSGKGDRDRYALLPEKTLTVLREYWREYRPTEWLFVSERSEHFTERGVQDAFKSIVKRSGIPKKLTIHSLRHAFATHLLNEGKNVFEIKRLLGHVRIDTTTWYLQLSENQKILYDLLFKASSETVRELALDKKYLGAEIGLTSILHTWGQNLTLHPHVHMIIPGGGITKSEWKNSRKKFFLPVKVMSKMFRGKFLCFLKNSANKLKLTGSLEYLKDAAQLKSLISSLYDKDWYIYCKRPFKTTNSVLEYLGRYTHRVAVSNHRIISCADSQVSFKWRDYRDGNKAKIMTISANEFMRRFLLHILPQGFTKIRHYGFLASAVKKKKLALCKKLTDTKPQPPKVKLSTTDLMKKLTGRDITLCPHCGGNLIRDSPFVLTA